MTSSTATILIVDDNRQNRTLLEMQLRREGYVTLCAANGDTRRISVRRVMKIRISDVSISKDRSVYQSKADAIPGSPPEGDRRTRRPSRGALAAAYIHLERPCPG